MLSQYLGHVDGGDPVYAYLQREILPQVGAYAEEGIRVFRANGSNDVYIYEDRRTGKRVVGKYFYAPRMDNWDVSQGRMEREYRNLLEARSYLRDPHYVARPLGRNAGLNRLLVTEYCYGEPMDQVILSAMTHHNDGLLYQKLTALAFFLSSMHNRSARRETVNFNEKCSYMDNLDTSLIGAGVIDRADYQELEWLHDRWRERPAMWADNQVFVHGDATPANFLFGDGLYVISFDLERGQLADRVFDLGRLAAELVHFFLRQTGNKYAAEPFIGHLLWEYSCHFPDRDRAFRAVTMRVPFYMGVTLLRIARNAYLEWNYRRSLVEEAKQCLRRFP